MFTSYDVTSQAALPRGFKPRLLAGLFFIQDAQIASIRSSVPPHQPVERQMKATHEVLRTAYREWMDAREHFEREMRLILFGGHQDLAKVSALLDRLNSTYRHFIEVGRPLVGVETINR
ncbi:hypothetical protein [Paraburkholderia monticola]|nr:hypothetical protein [Paraburkholderia monticola]